MAKAKVFKKYILPIVAVLLIVIFVLPITLTYIYFFAVVPIVVLGNIVFNPPISPKVSAEESVRNFPVYEERLITIAEAYGYELEDYVSTFESSPEKERRYRIDISDDESLRIDVLNSSGESEGFRVTYECDNSQTEHEFNVDLFIDLVNCLWKKTLTKEYCIDLLEAPEEKYQALGNRKMNGELLAKRDSDFWGSYTFQYRISKDNIASLSISGLTNRPERLGLLKEKAK